MKNVIKVLIIIVLNVSVSYAQAVKFRFDIDGSEFLSIRENASGFKYIQQTSSQTSMFFGYHSGLNNTTGAVPLYGKNNTAFGFSTLSNNTIGFSNTAIGGNALSSNISGGSNTAMGASALRYHEEGGNNIAIGQSSMYKDIDGSQNVAIGPFALYNAKNSMYSVAIGSTAGINDTLSLNNTYIGFGSGRGTVFATDGYDRSNNVMIGSQSGYSCSTSGNVFIGYKSGKNAKVDNQLYISNTDTDSLNSLIYGQFDNKLLRINGDLNMDGLYTFPNTAPNGGDYLKYNGGSNLTWSSVSHPWQLGPGDDLSYEDGFVGIGISDAEHLLDVLGSGSGTAGGYIAKFRNITASTTNSRGIQIQLGPNSNPTTSNTYMVFLDGNGTNIGSIRGNGSGGTQFSTTSDKRLKQNIVTFDKGLETIAKIRPALYQMKSNPTVDEIGFIAQELEEILPIAVGGSPDGNVETAPMTVDYSRLTPVLVAALKEQQVLINKLTERLNESEMQFKQLKADVSSLLGANATVGISK